MSSDLLITDLLLMGTLALLHIFLIVKPSGTSGYKRIEMTDVFSVTGLQRSSQGCSSGFTMQLGPLRLTHQPRLDIFIANNHYD